MPKFSSEQCAAVVTFLDKQKQGEVNFLEFWYASQGTARLDGSAEESDAAFNHIQSCSSCTLWVRTKISDESWQRCDRLKRYCCASMFAAVEEADSGNSVEFSFRIIRDDPCWQISKVQCYAQYCPWCGKALPDKPFIIADSK